MNHLKIERICKFIFIEYEKSCRKDFVFPAGFFVSQSGYRVSAVPK